MRRGGYEASSVVCAEAIPVNSSNAASLLNPPATPDIEFSSGGGDLPVALTGTCSGRREDTEHPTAGIIGHFLRVLPVSCLHTPQG